MAKSKDETKTKDPIAQTTEVKLPPISSFSKFSKFGGTPSAFGGPKFTPKTFNARPTFITQHKGGGGK